MPDAQAEAPSRLLLLAETRALGEIALGLASRRTFAAAPRGDGHTVLVLPGFLGSDKSTEFLRETLNRLGHRAVGWELGRNLGPNAQIRERLAERVHTLHRESGGRISIVGWSLGGVYARAIALRTPETVRGVVSLGSPFRGNLRASHAAPLYDVIAADPISRGTPADVAALAGPLPVPATSIYSRSDGIVHWRTSVGETSPTAENIEVFGASHFGLGFNPAVLWAVADRVAQPEHRFRPFRPTGPFWPAYRLSK